MDEQRIRQLEIQLTALTGDVKSHKRLCDARWQVAWKLAAGVTGLLISVGIAALFR